MMEKMWGDGSREYIARVRVCFFFSFFLFFFSLWKGSCFLDLLHGFECPVGEEGET